jgi:DNA-binding transcriptional MocR family regulator
VSTSGARSFIDMNIPGENSIRNLKEAEWYWIEKAILSHYGQRLKPSGIAVYNGLAFFANSETGNCFPSHDTLAELVGIGKRTVRRKLKQLAALGLIKAEKRRGSSLYHLLKPGSRMSPREDKRAPAEWTPGPPNNNYRTRINKLNIDSKNFQKFDASTFMGFKPKTREEVLALDLAQGLDDHKGLPLYLSYSRKFPEALLRRVLSEVKAMPAKQIKKSRGALFNYLIQKHAKETSHHPGD